MRRLARLAGLAAGAALLVAAFTLAWLYADAHRDRAAWFAERQGELLPASRAPAPAPPALAAEHITLESSSGLRVSLRLLRPREQSGQLPVLVLLGGHRTGADAVELFPSLDNLAVVAMDYPYDGPLRTYTLASTLGALPAVRSAFLDAAPALSLAVDWLQDEAWVDHERIALAGVSLGVPFAATAAARDERFAALLLVHGAADNRAWIRHNLVRRINLGPLQGAASYVANWLVYGPLHDTGRHVARISPRPVIIIGASEDERTPRWQTEALFAAAGEPKVLRWTPGRHVQPGRRDIVRELLQLSVEELSRALQQPASDSPEISL